MADSLIAYCGLYCGACSFQVAYETKDRKHIDSMPSRYDKYKNDEPENCPGCRLENKCGDCEIRDCAVSKKVDYCIQCGDYPCKIITAFGNDGVPHHAEIFNNLKELKELGEKEWLERKKQEYMCPVCKTRFSWYNKKCTCN